MSRLRNTRREAFRGAIVGGVVIPSLGFVAALVSGDVGGFLFWITFAVVCGLIGAALGVMVSKIKERDS